MVVGFSSGNRFIEWVCDILARTRCVGTLSFGGHHALLKTTSLVSKNAYQV